MQSVATFHQQSSVQMVSKQGLLWKDNLLNLLLRMLWNITLISWGHLSCCVCSKLLTQSQLTCWAAECETESSMLYKHFLAIAKIFVWYQHCSGHRSVKHPIGCCEES